MTLGIDTLGVEELGADFIRTPPSVELTGPASTVSTTTATVTWTYTSLVSRAQAKYRVKLLNQDGSVVLFDSGIKLGADVSYAPAFFLADSSTYTVRVSASDGYDWSPEVDGSFSVDLADVGDYPDVEVGTVYEVGINGVGYMLADTPAGELQYRRQTISLQAPRFAQGDTPFSEAVERYTFIGWSDFRDGAGQKQRNRGDSSPAAFYDSEGVNPFEQEGLQLLPQMSYDLINGYSNPLAVIASNKLYSLTGANDIVEYTDIGGSTTDFSVAAAGTVVAMASDGTNWYVADGVGVFQGDDATDPGAAWSALDAQVIHWAADRLCIAYASSGSAPNVFSTLAGDGTEEVASGRIVLPVGSTITSICGGDGYVWFSARRGQQGLVYAWKAGTTDTPFVAFEFPTGQFPQSLGFYLGNVFIRCVEPLPTTGNKAVIYRAATSTGRLIPELVTEIEDAGVDHTVGAWGGDARFALFSWKGVHSSTASGVGCIDLSTGGYARWLCAPVGDFADADGDVVSVLQWNGRTVLSIAGYGTVVEDTEPMATGFLNTDISDLATSMSKVYGQIKGDMAPLPTGGTVAIKYTMDAGNSYSTDTFTLTGAGLQSLSGVLDKQGVSLGLKITLTATTVSPVLRSVTVRAHPLGLADQVLILPINCADRLDDLRGKELPESGHGRGATRARVLESLEQTRVRLQDIDWVDTTTATIWEVEQVDVRTVSVFDRAQKKQVHSQIAVLMLRRSLR